MSTGPQLSAIMLIPTNTYSASVSQKYPFFFLGEGMWKTGLLILHSNQQSFFQGTVTHRRPRHMYNNRGRTLVMKTTVALNHFTLTMLTHHWKSEISHSKLKCESLIQKSYTFLIPSKYWHTLSFMAWWFT